MAATAASPASSCVIILSKKNLSSPPLLSRTTPAVATPQFHGRRMPSFGPSFSLERRRWVGGAIPRSLQQGVVRAASSSSSSFSSMPPLPAALLFDCDGVLVDTEKDGHRISFNETFAEVWCYNFWFRLGIRCLYANKDFDLNYFADTWFGLYCIVIIQWLSFLSIWTFMFAEPLCVVAKVLILSKLIDLISQLVVNGWSWQNFLFQLNDFPCFELWFNRESCYCLVLISKEAWSPWYLSFKLDIDRGVSVVCSTIQIDFFVFSFQENRRFFLWCLVVQLQRELGVSWDVELYGELLKIGGGKER